MPSSAPRRRPTTTQLQSHTIPAGPLFWEALPNGRLAHDSPSWRAYTGQMEPLSPTDWLNSALHPDDRAATLSTWERALHARQPFSLVHRLLGADGVYRRFLTQAAPIAETQKAAARWQGVSCDLTDALRESEQRQQQLEASVAARAAELEAVFEAMADSVYVYDAQGQLVRTNAAARLLNPLTAKSAYRTEPFKDRIQAFAVRDAEGHPLAPEQTPIARVLRGERVVDVDTQMRQLNGHNVQLSTSGGPILDSHGQQNGAIVVIRDVTARRQLEQRMQEALKVLLRVARVVDEPTIQANTNALLARLAKALMEISWVDFAHALLIGLQPLHLTPVAMFGPTKAEVERWRQEIATFAPSDDPRLAQVVELLRAGRTLAQRFPTTTPLIAPLTARRQRVQMAITAPVVVEGELVGLLTVARSGSGKSSPANEFAPWDEELLAGVARLAGEAIERGRLGAQLVTAEAARLAAEAATRQRDEFLGVISHELRTPITSIKASVQMTTRAIEHYNQSHEPDAGLSRVFMLLRRADRQIARLNRIVEDMLDMAGIQAGTLQVYREYADLSAVARDAIEEQRLLWPERAIEFEAPDAPVMVNMDVERIWQVIINYLANAFKYSPSDAPVTARIVVKGDRARVEVSDHGPGIRAAEHERIWERFYRAPDVAVMSGSGVGLGLGLYLCKTIIERHGGAVGVESAEGEGSTFWFTLPL